MLFTNRFHEEIKKISVRTNLQKEDKKKMECLQTVITSSKPKALKKKAATGKNK